VRARAVAWILLVIALGAACAVQLGSGSRIQTDLLAMLPATERNAAAEAAAARLGELAGKRAVFLVSAADAQRSKAAAVRLGALLADSGAFARVQTTLPPFDPASVARFYTPYRFRVAAAGEPLAGDADVWRSRLATRLASPVAGVPGAGPEVDPFGTLGRFIAELPFRSMRLQLEDNLLVVHDQARVHVLVSAELAGSPYTPEVQQKSVAAYDAAKAVLEREIADVRIVRTGTVFFGAAARQSAEHDTRIIGLGSLAGIALMLVVLFRSARHLLLGLACIGAGLLTATVVCLAIYRELNVLTIVAGSSLIGVVIDYPLQYFARHLESGEWKPLEALASITPAIGIGVASAVLGYAALFIAPFPGLRQIAVFSVVGLLAAFATVYLLLPWGLARPARARFPQWPVRLIGAWRRAFTPRRVAWSIAVLAIAIAPGLATLKAGDDVRALIAPPADLVDDDARIRELVGLAATSQFFLIEGDSEAQVLEREERLGERLAQLVRRGELGAYQAISSFVPSPQRQQRIAREYTAAAPELGATLREAGFRTGIVDSFESQLRAPQDSPLHVGAWLDAPFSAPFRHLWLSDIGEGAASAVIPAGFRDTSVLGAAARDLAGVTFVDKAGSISALLGHYRSVTAAALAFAFPLVGLGLAWRYGVKGAVVVLLPPLLGIGAALAATAYAGAALSLFNVLALVLVLGIGVDYSVFLKEGGERLPAAVLGVVLAAATTLLSFGLLALSGTPALRAFGSTLAVGVSVAALLSPIVLSASGRAR
jgi:predicted exporter